MSNTTDRNPVSPRRPRGTADRVSISRLRDIIVSPRAPAWDRRLRQRQQHVVRGDED